MLSGGAVGGSSGTWGSEGNLANKFVYSRGFLFIFRSGRFPIQIIYLVQIQNPTFPWRFAKQDTLR
jgi:hypothetical protein